MSIDMQMPAPAAADVRPAWKTVALPSEHGGWGLTLEPVLLGLLVAWSWPGLLLGVAAFTAFLARTPAKLVAVDSRRERWLPRTRLALFVAAAEGVVIVACAAAATVMGDARWWWAVAAAVPLVAVEWWFDIRSRGRRLVPELCGALGVAATAAAIVLVAHGDDIRLAAAVWLVLAARSVGAIPFVRAQILRARRGITDVRSSDVAQSVAVAIAACAVLFRRDAAAGAVGVLVLAVVQAWWSRHDPPAVKVLGLRQMALGLLLVAVTATGVLVS